MVEKQHPGDPHYYLPYIAVAPTRQGNGLGTALLRPVLDRCDTEGAPAYLEATNKRNLPLYRRQESNSQLLEYECYAYAREGTDAISK